MSTKYHKKSFYFLFLDRDPRPIEPGPVGQRGRPGDGQRGRRLANDARHVG